ncbi:MAG: MBL fold metallo-hydrolase [Candidatus Dependentiae bacterium]
MTKKRFSNPPGSKPYPHSFTRSCAEIFRYAKSMCRSLLGLRRTQAQVPLPDVVPTKTILENIDGSRTSRDDRPRGRDDAPRITWLGHASMLLQVDGVNIITDPFLSSHAASFPPFGTKRVTPPALRVEELPAIDVVLISHAHYDHCDRVALKKLAADQQPLVFVPLGLGPLLTQWGFTNVHEMNWHDRATHAGVTITFLPAIHHARRFLFDYNTTLWGGFGIKGSNTNLYFAGDTALGPVFDELGKEYGPFDVGMVPIGGYCPESVLRFVHSTPEDAVAIGRAISCTQLIAMHWGALPLTDEPMDEPPKRFVAAGKKAGYNKNELKVLSIGETVVLSS